MVSDDDDRRKSGPENQTAIKEVLAYRFVSKSQHATVERGGLADGRQHSRVLARRKAGPPRAPRARLPHAHHLAQRPPARIACKTTFK